MKRLPNSQRRPGAPHSPSRRWLAENQLAITEYNKRVAKWGVFSDGLRRF